MQMMTCSRSNSLPEFGLRFLFSLATATLLLLLSLTTVAQQTRPEATLHVTTADDKEQAVAAVQVQLKRAGAVVATVTTNEKGEATFPNLTPGIYEVVVSKVGFETLTQPDVNVTVSTPVEVKFTLIPKIELKEEITVQGKGATPVEQGASPAAELQRAKVKELPNKPATVADTLPLIPGVTRSPDGEIRISGQGEHRSALVVNAADVTDPATGQFGMTVPVDSVETINVFKTPYLAQYGRFTAGVVAVETRRGGDKWDFELNDPLPEFRFRSKHLRGLREASPRVTFNGPIIANRFYISQGMEYELVKRAERTLPFPFNETKTESVNSFTQLDYILSPTHTLTGTFHATPRHANFINLNFFNPQPVTPSFSARDYTGTVIDHLAIGNNLLESTVAIKRSTDGVWGQGQVEMVLTPTGNRGNYFSEQNRRASRVEWIETLSLVPISHYGSHHLKFGTTMARTTNRGEFTARPVDVLNNNGQRVKRLEFVNGHPYDRHDVELGVFGQDHWVMSPKFSLDLGLRFERQGITDTFRIAPRIGAAWTPFSNKATVIRGGVGIFYDRVPLNVFSFYRYPEQIITTYGANGQILDVHHYTNITDRAEGRKFPFIRSRDNIGNFAPYSATWNVEVEHPISRLLRIRANYLLSNSYGLVIVTPKVVQGRDAFVEGSGGKARYRQLELTARFAWKDEKEILFSYVRSRAQGDLNEFNNYLGNFPSPILRPNQYSNLPGDLPNRFLAWGLVKLPLKLRISPMVEYRNGFPYATIDAARNYVGTPNKVRFPNFFSLDMRVSKDFQVNPKYTLRFAVSGFNLTNHFNALSVHANTADPQFGAFFGNYKRRFRVDFDVIF